MSSPAFATAPSAAFRLVRYFSLTSLAGVVLITGALIWAYQHYTERLLVQHESRANADLTRAFANTVWRDYGTTSPARSAARASRWPGILRSPDSTTTC